MMPKKPLLSLAQAALRDEESGYKQHARSEENAAIKLAANRDVEGIAGLALARAGDLAAAEKVAVEVIRPLVSLMFLATGCASSRADGGPMRRYNPPMLGGKAVGKAFDAGV